MTDTYPRMEGNETHRRSASATIEPSTRAVAAFLANVRYHDLSPETVERTKALCLDWLGSTLAGATSEPIAILRRFARAMGPSSGPATLVPPHETSSAFFAALVNGASSHVVDMDDLHNGAVVHPGTVVFPAAFAAAQDLAATGRNVIVGAVVGYEACLRVGEYLGRSHDRVFHTAGTAGTLGAAAAVAHLHGADAETMRHALGSAGTQASGVWEFLRDGAMSKQLHAGKAAANGLLAAYLAYDGFTAAARILEGPVGLGAAMSEDADVMRLVAGLETYPPHWKVLETSFTYHASCRHTHPAADALLHIMRTRALAASDLASVRVRTYRAAAQVLGSVGVPRTPHEATCSLGTVLALIALHGRAGVADFDADMLRSLDVRSLAERVTMEVDDAVDAAYPAHWGAIVAVDTVDGQTFSARIDAPKGDPDNPLTVQEVEDKFRTLASFNGGLTPRAATTLIARIHALDRVDNLDDLCREVG